MNNVRNPNKRPRNKQKISDRKREVKAELRYEQSYVRFLKKMQEVEDILSFYSPDIEDYDSMTRGFEIIVKLMDRIVVKGKAAKRKRWNMSDDPGEEFNDGAGEIL